MHSFKLQLIKIGLFLISSILIVSCANKKDYIYFQHQLSDSLISINQKPFIPVLKSDDMISISISSVDPDVVKPFNNGGISGSEKGSMNATAPTYLIDDQGNIDFPVLGTIKLAGMTRVQATLMLKERIKSYVTNPIVQVKILNHKVSVLGEVKTPGVYPMQHEQLTLPEALAMAGDLQITAVRKNVLVVREIDGVKTEIRVDMTSRSFFSSPAYYLRNNDLIYIEPNKAKISSSGQTLQYTSLAIGSLGLILNILNLLSK